MFVNELTATESHSHHLLIVKDQERTWLFTTNYAKGIRPSSDGKKEDRSKDPKLLEQQ